jgi:hypothetical protein
VHTLRLDPQVEPPQGEEKLAMLKEIAEENKVSGGCN